MGNSYPVAGPHCGGEWPLNFLLLGGTPVGNAVVGYSGDKLYTPEQVCEIAAALEAIPGSLLRERFDPEQMDLGADDDEALETATSTYQELRSFIRSAVADSDGLVLTMY